MKSQKDVFLAVQNGRKSECAVLDSRDYARLIDFFPSDQWKVFDFELKEGKTHEPEAWTRENILVHLEADLSFAIKKAKGERGISSELMYYVVKMWLWILDDPLQHHGDYHSYGLPFFEEVKVKYAETFKALATRAGQEVVP